MFISLLEAVGAIWALSFDEENRKVMVNKEKLDVVSTLLILKSSEDLKVKASANGTLWNLRVDLEKTEGFRELGMFILISTLRNESFAGQKKLEPNNFGRSQGFNQKGVSGVYSVCLLISKESRKKAILDNPKAEQNTLFCKSVMFQQLRVLLANDLFL